MVSVSAILLAAGASTRMGEQKALLGWEGTTLIDYQLAQLARVPEIGQILVVTGHDPSQIEAAVERYPRAEAVRNADWATGKVSSIRTGVEHVAPDADAILLLAVDQPREAALLRTLVRAHAASRTSITVPVSDGRRGHPVLFVRALLPELSTLSEETQGIRAVMQRHAASVREVEVADAAIHVDLNRPADLEKGRG